MKYRLGCCCTISILFRVSSLALAQPTTLSFSNRTAAAGIDASYGGTGCFLGGGVVGDFNNDGRRTVLTDVPANQTLTIASDPPSVSGDLNNDDCVDLSDLAIQLSSFTRSGRGDLDADGDTDLDDVIALLTRFGVVDCNP